MAEINNETSLRRTGRGVRKPLRRIVRIDMTPMVDLGFLLITFFVMTAELSRPVTAELIMPKDNKNVPPTTLSEKNAITLMLHGKKCYYYKGKWEDAVANNQVLPTDLSLAHGIGNQIRAMQKELDADPQSKEKRAGLMLLIKASPNADYRQVIDALDETTINAVKKFAIVKLEAFEMEFLVDRL